MRSSPINTTNSSPLLIPLTTTNTNEISSIVTNASTSPTITIIETDKQIIIQDIDRTKYKEISTKEPDLTWQPEKKCITETSFNILMRIFTGRLISHQKPIFFDWKPC